MTAQIPTLGDRLREIHAAAVAEHADPATYVMDYFAEKDSRITREGAQRMLRLHVPDYTPEVQR